MHVARPDGLLEICADVILKARQDYARGPALGKHFDSAKAFLEQAGILDTQGTRTPAGVPSVAMADGCAEPPPMENYV